LAHRGKSGSQFGGIEEVLDREPTPEFAAEFDRRLTQLDDRGLREIVLHKMEGFTNAAIAQDRGCTERTVFPRKGS